MIMFCVANRFISLNLNISKSILRSSQLEYGLIHENNCIHLNVSISKVKYFLVGPPHFGMIQRREKGDRVYIAAKSVSPFFNLRFSSTVEFCVDLFMYSCRLIQCLISGCFPDIWPYPESTRIFKMPPNLHGHSSCPLARIYIQPKAR